MSGRSLMNVILSKKAGLVDKLRDHVLTGKERHTPCHIGHMGGTPMRAIRNKDFLYIHNFKPDRWPAGDPAGSVRGRKWSDIDDGPTKKYITDRKDDPKFKKFYEWSCGKRPADELYDLKKDPDQLNNVADDPAYAAELKRLKAQLMKELLANDDPRAKGQGDVFETYPYLGSVKNKLPNMK